jgi:hypothetical protein
MEVEVEAQVRSHLQASTSSVHTPDSRDHEPLGYHTRPPPGPAETGLFPVAPARLGRLLHPPNPEPVRDRLLPEDAP